MADADPKPPPKTRVVSVRVPIGLPEKVKAHTGVSFSAAVTQFFEPFIDSLLQQQQKKDQESSHD